MKRLLAVCALSAAAVLAPAAPASAAKCVYWGGTGIHVILIEGEQVYVPLYEVDPHCLDHLLP